MSIGYTKDLFILPFDHRSTFEKAGFSAKGGPASGWKDIAGLKLLIYEAFKKSQSTIGEGAAILVDEKYGEKILLDAKENGITTLLTIEKSGREDFEFEYEKEFAEHIIKFSPTFAKVLIKVRNGITDLTKENLKKLNSFCFGNGIKLLIEIVSDGNLDLILKSIADLQDFSVEPDVWKVEGMDKREDLEKIVDLARRDGRNEVSIVILGRGEGKERVSNWIKVGAGVPGVIGFAVGRTVFWDPISEFNSEKINREEAIEKISENYIYFYNLFKNSR